MSRDIKSHDGYTMLQIGRYYRIKDSVTHKVTNGDIKYCGIDKYNGKEYHSFFDGITRLFHWIDADKVEPCL